MGIAYNTSIVRDGLVLHLDATNVKSYPGSGTVWKDLSRSHLDFTLQNGVSYNTTDGYYMQTDGINDMIIASDSININFSAYTVSVWFMRVNGTSQRILSKRDTGNQFTTPFYMNVGSSGTLYFDTPDGINRNTLNNGFIPTFSGNMENLVFVYTGTHRYVYQNTVLIASDTFSGTPYNNTESYRIGSSVETYTSVKISSMMIYDRGLSESEIIKNFEAFRIRYGYDTTPTAYISYADRVSFSDTSSPYTNAITAMSTVNSGDLLIMSERMTITLGGSATYNPPAGWTAISSLYDTSEFMMIGLAYKIADGSESSSSISTGITGITNQSGYESQLLRFEGNISSVTSGSIGTRDNAGGGTISASTGTTPLLVLSLVACRTSGSITSHTIGGAGIAISDIDDSHSLAYLIQSTTPLDVASSYSSSSGEREIYGYLQVS